MDQEKRHDRSPIWRQKIKIQKIWLSGIIYLALVSVVMALAGVPTAYASGPGGNVADPVVRAVDIAQPAVVRIITEGVAQLTVNFSQGAPVTFPATPQNGVNGYQFQISGSGAFISAHGNILTADHVVNPTPDLAQQLAAQDVANYINQHQKPAQPVSANNVFNELVTGQLASTPHYTQVRSLALLSTAFTGPISATSLQNLPRSQGANVDQIVAQTSFDTTDTAIIHVSGLDNMPMLQLGDASGVQPQDQLTIIGFPGNGDVNSDPTSFLTSSINQIFVSAIKPNAGATVIQVGGNVEHGDSGGPALDKNGQVVGIVSFGVTSGGNGETSFLQTTTTAKQLIQQAHIDTTPSPFQKAWSQAFNDYASTAAGHWHKAMNEFKQLSTQYPQFKAIQPFLQYATQQAQTEAVPTPTASSSAPTASGGLNPVPIIIGGVLVLAALFGGGLVVSRGRRGKSAPAPGTVVTPAGYGVPTTPAPGAGYPGTPGQGQGQAYLPAGAPGAVQARPAQNPVATIPNTPGYSPANAYQQPGPFHQPGQPQQQGMGNSNVGMAAFGAPLPPAPSVVPSTPQPAAGSGANLSADATVTQWRVWPCGHVNRYDARFCGTCGEIAPSPPQTRRVEQ